MLAEILREQLQPDHVVYFFGKAGSFWEASRQRLTATNDAAGPKDACFNKLPAPSVTPARRIRGEPSVDVPGRKLGSMVRISGL